MILTILLPVLNSQEVQYLLLLLKMKMQKVAKAKKMETEKSPKRIGMRSCI